MATKAVKNTKAMSRKLILGWLGVWLVLGYAAASGAIDTGSWLYYFAAFLSCAQLLRLMKLLIKSYGK